MSREGVQRDLLPLIEGTTVATKYGPVKTDHILFIASGAFHVAKPSDLLPELQGRLPIRVELRALEKEDFVRILTETEASLIKQYIALMETEGVKLSFTDDAIDSLAGIAVDLNSSVENIGARRLQTVMERVLDDISYNAPDKSGTEVVIDAGLCRQACRRPRQEHRFVAIYPLGKKRAPRLRLGARSFRARSVCRRKASTSSGAFPTLRDLSPNIESCSRLNWRLPASTIAALLAGAVAAARGNGRAPWQPFPGAATRSRRFGLAHRGAQDDLRGKVPQGLQAARERQEVALEDPRGSRRLRHRPHAHGRGDRRRTHLQCRCLRPAADLLREGDLLSGFGDFLHL